MKTKRAHDRLLIKQQFECFYCGHLIARSRVARRTRGFRRSSVDHVVPKSKGGENKMENYVAACKNCNVKKGVKTVEEFKP